MNMSEIAQKYENYLIELRREFHRIPEPAFEEYKTSKRIKEELDKFGISYRSVGETGILADIHGGYPGPRVALRGDMDALKIKENTGLPYASSHDGYMHACGHDTHISMMLCAARILNEMREELHGDVRIIFEPAEEIAKGALSMIKGGAMENVDTVFGMHIWSDVQAGKISLEAGPRMASADFFTIDIKGKGCHGSMPHQGIDAITVGAALVNNMQAAVGREFSPLEPVVISICEFKAGTCHNQIAGSAFMSGTTRAFSRELRDRIPQVMERIVRKTAETFGAEAVLNYEMGSSPVTNDAACSAIAAKAAEETFGKENIVLYEKTAGGENFSEYQYLAPGVFAFVGTRNPDLDAVYPQHSDHYKIDESVLIKGAATAVQYVLKYMEAHNKS